MGQHIGTKSTVSYYEIWLQYTTCTTSLYLEVFFNYLVRCCQYFYNYKFITWDSHVLQVFSISFIISLSVMLGSDLLSAMISLGMMRQATPSNFWMVVFKVA